MPAPESLNHELRHSAEMDEIISAPPPALISWGIATFVIILLLLAAMAAFISYPTVISADLKITSTEKDVFYAGLSVQQSDITKVLIGQEVIVKLRSYPADDYGSLRGKIVKVSSDIGANGEYTATVAITSNHTDVNKTVPLQPGMQADADIIIQKATVLQRVGRDLIRIPGIH